eukprot:3047212-Pleurochrysis_carterae.AAC.4
MADSASNWDRLIHSISKVSRKETCKVVQRLGRNNLFGPGFCHDVPRMLLVAESNCGKSGLHEAHIDQRSCNEPQIQASLL